MTRASSGLIGSPGCRLTVVTRLTVTNPGSVWQADDEPASIADVVRLHLAAVGFDEAPHDSKAQARAGIARRTSPGATKGDIEEMG